MTDKKAAAMRESARTALKSEMRAGVVSDVEKRANTKRVAWIGAVGLSIVCAFILWRSRKG